MNLNAVTQSIRANIIPIAVINTVGAAVLFFLFCLTAGKTAVLNKKINIFVEDSSGENIADALGIVSW